MTAKPLRLGGVPEHFNLPWHLAMESDDPSSGLADLSLRWEDQRGGTGEMLAKLADSELDLVSILTEGTVKAIAGGLPVTILQVYVESPLQWGVFVPGPSEFQEPDDLAGARIAISRFGSGSHLMAYIMAERMGWALTEDQFVVINNLEGAIEAFGRAEADLFLWDQFMTRPLVLDGRFRQLGVQETPWPSFVFAARDEILTGRTTEVGRVVDAVVAQAGMLMASATGPELVADRYGIGLDAATEWFAATTFATRQPMPADIATDVAETLQRAGLQ